MTRFTIEIRESDDPRVVHLILRDQNGRRAERVCQNGQELANLLDGWTRSYRCDARELLLQTLFGLLATQCHGTSLTGATAAGAKA